MFTRTLRRLIAEYEPDETLIDDEIATLREILFHEPKCEPRPRRFFLISRLGRPHGAGRQSKPMAAAMNFRPSWSISWRSRLDHDLVEIRGVISREAPRRVCDARAHHHTIHGSAGIPPAPTPGGR